MSPNVVPFAVIFVVAVVFFGWSTFKRFRLITLGKTSSLPLGTKNQ